MYLHGLRDIFTDEAQATGDPVLIASSEGYGGYGGYGGDISTAPSTTGPTASMDWTRLIGTAITTWGNVTVAKRNADTQVALASRGYPVASYYNPMTGSYVYPGAAAAAPMTGTTLLLIAAAAAATFFLLKD